MQDSRWSAVVTIGLSCVVFSVGSGAARAQVPAGGAEPGEGDQLADIVVTAERRETSLQKTSVSVATVSGADIDKGGLKSLDEVAKDLPNVMISTSAVGYEATIRGIGASPIPPDIGGSSGVANLYDGLYTLQDQAGRTGFYDVQRFEVLLGPQGTLYGRNAEGGVVNVITNNPTHTAEEDFTAELGNYSLYRVTGVANVPLSDDLAVRVAAARVSRDGYLSNGQDDNVATGVRLKGLYTPGDAVSLLVAGDFTHSAGEGLGTVLSTTYPLSNPWTSPNPANQSTTNNSYRLWLNLNVDTSIGTLTLIPAYQGSGPEHHDQYTGAYNNVGENPQSLVQRSLESRFASPHGSPFDWVFGVYLYNYGQVATGFDTTLDGNGQIITDPNNPILNNPSNPDFIPYYNKTTTQTSDAVAGFAQATVPITSKARVIGGVRDSRDRSSIETIWDVKPQFGGGTSAFYPLTRGEWHHFDWKTGVEYDVVPASMLYATVATGYRPGGFDPLPTGGFTLESLRSYEVGSKNEFLDNRVRANAALFYYDYKNYQVVTFVPGGPLGAEPEVLNADKATVYGGELQATWVISAADRVSTAVGYLHSEIQSPVSVSNPDGAGPAALIGIEGNTLANSPEWTVTASGHHAFPLPNGAEIAIDPSVRYVSSYHVTPAEGLTSDQAGYYKADVSASFVPRSRNWTVTAYGRNLADKAVKSAYLPAPYLLLQPPRTYGVVVNAHF
jgi:iron complex outermembrane recepter protein